MPLYYTVPQKAVAAQAVPADVLRLCTELECSCCHATVIAQPQAYEAAQDLAKKAKQECRVYCTDCFTAEFEHSDDKGCGLLLQDPDIVSYVRKRQLERN